MIMVGESFLSLTLSKSVVLNIFNVLKCRKIRILLIKDNILLHV